MIGRKVLAAVVTFNPEPSLAGNLQALRAQCSDVVVIDNASGNREWVQQACDAAGCTMIGNDSNLGVAAALSQAARLAQQRGADWLATFDQDSLCPPDGITGLLDLYDVHPERERIAIVAFSHRDRATGRDYHHPVDILAQGEQWYSLRTTITSGSLTRVDLFSRLGLFDDKLFIDMVDHEFCLRVRKHGWLVIEGRQLVVAHSIGAATVHKLLGLSVVCTHHSPTRRYYMTRNQLEIYARNVFSDPLWVVKGAVLFSSGVIATMLYEPNKLANLRAMLRGVAHFIFRRFGPIA